MGPSPWGSREGGGTGFSNTGGGNSLALFSGRSDVGQKPGGLGGVVPDGAPCPRGHQPAPCSWQRLRPSPRAHRPPPNRAGASPLPPIPPSRGLPRLHPPRGPDPGRPPTRAPLSPAPRGRRAAARAPIGLQAERTRWARGFQSETRNPVSSSEPIKTPQRRGRDRRLPARTQPEGHWLPGRGRAGGRPSPGAASGKAIPDVAKSEAKFTGRGPAWQPARCSAPSAPDARPQPPARARRGQARTGPGAARGPG